ncbi:hypothetical protein [Sorangium sp. So ce131]|uniref:hypothetical protein n=1 Tax=Sorangium sp. So ce131 TaxID=3133282 RepID=UPI003F5E12AA
MSTQYDDVAEQYKKAKRLAVSDVIEDTLLGRLGAVTGMSVLDLACGEGFNTRGRWAAGPAKFLKYGFGFEAPSPLGDGDQVRLVVQVDDRSWIHIAMRSFSRETYTWALTAAGFRDVAWHGPVLPPEIEARDGEAFWGALLEDPPIVLIECWK